MYGGKKKKTLNIFIDDVHLPKYDICYVQSSNELLRQIADQRMIFTIPSKHFKPKYIEGLKLMTTLNSSSNDKKKLDRLLVRIKYSQLQLSYKLRMSVYSFVLKLWGRIVILKNGLI